MSRLFTEKELIDFSNYFASKDIKPGQWFKEVSDADLRNYFGADYDHIKYERKEKLIELQESYKQKNNSK